MKNLLIATAALAAILGCAGAANAQVAPGNQFLFQFDETATGLFGNTYENGNLIQSVNVGDEAYFGGYGLWNSAVLVNSFDVAVNIYDPHNGPLSDTWHLFGTAGASFLDIPFISGDDGPLLPLENAQSLIETGGFQTVLEFTVSNGDHYTWQFRSPEEGGVPEPAAWTMMIGGFGLAGAVLRRRRAAVTA